MEKISSFHSLIENEFRFENLKLDHPDARVFYSSEWTESRSFYLKYRVVVFLYMLIWLIYDLATDDGRFFLYLTNIQVLIINFYLLTSMVVVFSSFQIRNVPGNHRTAWLHQTEFLLQSISFNLSFIVVMLYWPLVAPHSTKPQLTGINLHSHGATLIVMVIDLFIIKLPVHQLHFVYTMAVAVIYFYYSLILHLTGVESAVYKFLDWESSPVRAAVIGSLFVFPGSFFAQSANFALYRLRLYIKNTPSVRARSDY